MLFYREAASKVFNKTFLIKPNKEKVTLDNKARITSTNNRNWRWRLFRAEPEGKKWKGIKRVYILIKQYESK